MVAQMQLAAAAERRYGITSAPRVLIGQAADFGDQ